MIVRELTILFYLRRNFNTLKIKYQSHPKSTKMDTFKQKKYACRKPLYIYIYI